MIMDPNDEKFNERIRLLANSILERFNEENVTPQEAGLVILALAHRLLTVLEKIRRSARISFCSLSVWSTSIWPETWRKIKFGSSVLGPS